MTYGEMFNLFIKEHPEYDAMLIDWRPQGRYEIKIWLRSDEYIFVQYNEKLETFEFKSSKSKADEDCNFCQGDPLCDFDFELNIRKYGENHLLEIEGFNQKESYKINYCPMCGNKL